MKAAVHSGKEKERVVQVYDSDYWMDILILG